MKGGDVERQERLAAALRENLRRRKAAARARETATGADESAPDPAEATRPAPAQGPRRDD